MFDVDVDFGFNEFFVSEEVLTYSRAVFCPQAEMRVSSSFSSRVKGNFRVTAHFGFSQVMLLSSRNCVQLFLFSTRSFRSSVFKIRRCSYPEFVST